jgi:hypothetical protein
MGTQQDRGQSCWINWTNARRLASWRSRSWIGRQARWCAWSGWMIREPYSVSGSITEARIARRFWGTRNPERASRMMPVYFSFRDICRTADSKMPRFAAKCKLCDYKCTSATTLDTSRTALLSRVLSILFFWTCRRIFLGRDRLVYSVP